MKKELMINNELVEVELIKQNSGEVSFIYLGEKYHFKRSGKSSGWQIMIDDKGQKTRFLYSAGAETEILHNGEIYKVKQALLSSEKFSGETRICAPLPARVIALFKKVGDEVKAGEDVICLEAMKMEHRLCAEISGFIKSINTSCGQQLKAGDLLVEISSENS